MRAEIFEDSYSSEEPQLSRITDPPCEGCPYNPGEGRYCMGHCLKEIMQSRRKGE